MTDTLSEYSALVVTKEQASCDLDGEVVILHLATGVYYGLDSVGARVWNLIQASKSAREIRDIILDEYDVEPERCEEDLVALLQKLAAEKLIEVKVEGTRSGARAEPA